MDAPQRALLVGGARADAERLAARLAPGARVICFAADAGTAAAMRQAIATRAGGAQVSVLVGDPALLVHKVAGPFDLILDAHGTTGAPRERLQALLAQHGELDG